MSGEGVALEDAPFPGEWRGRGACREVPMAVFFPGRGKETATARAVCGACPVIEECRAYALDVPGLKGVWGGLSEHARLLRRHEPVVPGVEVEVEVEVEAPPPVPGPATSAPGTLLAHLEELVGHQGQWARVARYASSHSAGALASLLRRGRRPVPAGRWCFEGHVDDEGGSALWACYEGAVDDEGPDEPLAG